MVSELGLALAEAETKHTDKATGAEWSTWRWSCEGEKLPGYATRARMYEAVAQSLGAYAIYSGAAHAEWHAVMAGWRELPRQGGGISLVPRSDLWATGGTVLGSTGCAIVPVHLALELLGRGTAGTVEQLAPIEQINSVRALPGEGSVARALCRRRLPTRRYGQGKVQRCSSPPSSEPSATMRSPGARVGCESLTLR